MTREVGQAHRLALEIGLDDRRVAAPNACRCRAAPARWPPPPAAAPARGAGARRRGNGHAAFDGLLDHAAGCRHRRRRQRPNRAVDHTAVSRSASAISESCCMRTVVRLYCFFFWRLSSREPRDTTRSVSLSARSGAPPQHQNISALQGPREGSEKTSSAARSASRVIVSQTEKLKAGASGRGGPPPLLPLPPLRPRPRSRCRILEGNSMRSSRTRKHAFDLGSRATRRWRPARRP